MGGSGMSFQKLSQIKIILIIYGRELCIYLIHVIHIFLRVYIGLMTLLLMRFDSLIIMLL